MSSPNIKKYRPSLPAHIIEHIVRLAKKDLSLQILPLDHNSDKELISILAPFQAKIENYGIAPSYTTSPKESVEESLGMIAPPLGQDKIAYNLNCYTKYKLALATDRLQSISLVMLDAAKEHMYVNDLMSPEEEKSYELAAIPTEAI